MGFLANTFTGTHYRLKFDSNGDMYLASKKPLDGYIPYYRKDTGAFVNYRMILKNGISGYLDRVAIGSMTTTTGGSIPVLNLGFRDYVTDEVFDFGFQIFTVKGNVSNYVKSFVKYYYNIDITKMLRFNSFKRKQGDEYPPQNLAFAYYNEGRAVTKDDMVPFYYKTGQNGWPEREKIIDPVKNVEVSDCKKQDAFAYQKLQEICNDFAKRIPEVRNKLKELYKDVEKKETSAFFPIPDDSDPEPVAAQEMPQDYENRYNAIYSQHPYQPQQYQQPAPPQYQQPVAPQQYGGYQAPVPPQYQQPVPPQYQQPQQPVQQPAPQQPVQRPVQQQATTQPVQPSPAAEAAQRPMEQQQNVHAANPEDFDKDYDDLPF